MSKGTKMLLLGVVIGFALTHVYARSMANKS